MSTENYARFTDSLTSPWHSNHMDEGNHLEAWRKLAGMTQKQLGHELGVSKGAIWKIESGDTALTFEKREKIAEVISVRMGIRFSGDDILREPPTRDSVYKMAQNSAPPTKGGVSKVKLLTHIVEGLVREYGALAVIEEATKASRDDKETDRHPSRRGITS